MTDCKSLFDTVNSAAGTGSQADKRAAIDVAVLKDHLRRLHIPLRWCPTESMIADNDKKYRR